ncbi:phosphotyrosine protein phosphatase [Erythrobacter sp. SG61-1L]|nr:low molecular weight protein-tyrosine-phosphatase [Erythrobacter sp. SG61-1L]KPL67617.1 phosphotyrosine protein phosphatase [Erythrobacter sp. SG61-1L]
MRPALLFVCLGNICRSPLAEAAMRQQAEAAGLDVYVESAATASYHTGKPIDERSLIVARKHGIDLSDHFARQVQAEDFMRFTHIFAIDKGVMNSLRQIVPQGATSSLEMLLDNVPGRQGQSVADPYFSEQDAFDITWADVSAAAAALVQRFKR